MVIKQAFAKINIGLRICNKRDDGYHNLETIFHRINIYDILKFEITPDISLSSSDPGLPLDESNLCVKAACILKDLYNVHQGIKITLEKKIPIGAGLGGGSSDAATTLSTLNTLWKLSLPDNEIHSLALSLGSDVPYFLRSGSAYAKGRGEILKYFDMGVPYWIVLVYPNVHVSTAWAYHQFQFKQSNRIITYDSRENEWTQAVDTNGNLWLRSNQQGSGNTFVNDFEEIVFTGYPIIAQIKQRLKELGSIFAQMSGSGSSVYGFFDSKEIAQSAMEEMEKNYRVFLTPPNFNPTK